MGHVHGAPRMCAGSEQLGGKGVEILTEWQASVTRFRRSSHLLCNTDNSGQLSNSAEKPTPQTWARPQRIHHVERHYDFFGNFQSFSEGLVILPQRKTSTRIAIIFSTWKKGRGRIGLTSRLGLQTKSPEMVA